MPLGIEVPIAVTWKTFASLLFAFLLSIGGWWLSGIDQGYKEQAEEIARQGAVLASQANQLDRIEGNVDGIYEFLLGKER